MKQRKLFKFPPEHPEDIGKWLIAERKQSAMTQEQLAKLMHLSQAQISRLEDEFYINAPFMQVLEVVLCLGWNFEYAKGEK